jgi:molybdate transport system ATP-binding protein
MEKTLIELHLKKEMHTMEGNRMLDIELKIPEYGFITLFGKSGVGKTTILRMIAGLSNPGSGFIKTGEDYWYDSSRKVNVRTQQRNIGFVFQDYALFPNMTVEEHLNYAQKKKDITHVNELLEIFKLEGLKRRKPDTLSGGQKQRVAVARALARRPQILLLDEPLSALDIEARQILQKEIMVAHNSFGATTILVSHDIDEISGLSGYVYIIDDCKIVSHGKPEDIFNKPGIAAGYPIEGRIISVSNKELTLIINGKKTVISLQGEEGGLFQAGGKVIISQH